MALAASRERMAKGLVTGRVGPCPLGTVVATALAARAGGLPAVTITSALRRTSSARAAQTLEPLIGRPPFQDEVLPFDISKCVHSLRGGPIPGVAGVGAKKFGAWCGG